MSVIFDVSGDGNVTPWTLPAGLSAVKSTARIVSGAVKPTYNDGPLTLIKVTTPNPTGLLDVVWTTAQDFNNPDGSGAAFINASGDGYFCKFYYDLAYIYSVVAGVITGGALGTLSGLTYSSGAQFRATYDTSINEIKLYNQASPGTAITTLSGLTPITGIAAGVGLFWEDSGSAGISAATLSNASAVATVDSYPATVRSGQTGIAYTTTGLSSVSGITVGPLSATSLSDTAGDGTHALPGLVDTVAHQLYGTKTVTVTGTGGTPTTTTSFLPPTGWNYVTLSGTLNTTTTGVINGFSPAAVVTDQIVFETIKGSVDAQGNYTGDYDGTQTVWHIQASTGIARSYLVVTGAAADTTPDSFSFNTPALAALGATVTSTNATISGIDAATAVSVTGGLVSINGGAFVSSGTITNGQTIAARVTASNSFSTAVTATVNIGGVNAQFIATTIAAPGDTEIDSITFPSSTNCVAGSAQASAVKGITGIDSASPVTAVTNCTYSINGAEPTSADGSVVNNQSIQLFANASNAPGATVNASITIGGQVFTWAITTAQPQISLPTQGGAMSGDARLNVLQKLTSNILAALNAGGAATIKPPDDETYQGSISHAGVALKQNINGWNSFIATWSATSGNHTIIVEGNETGLDADQWYALSGTPIDTASQGMVASRPVTTGYSGFVYAKRFPWVRIRVPTYGGGGATINCRLTVSCNSVSSAPYVTTITGMANNNNSATNSGPSPFFVTVGGITRPTNQISDVSGVSTPLTFSAGGQLAVKPYSVSESDWNFTVPAGGIVSSSSAQQAKAAPGAGIRNFVTWIDVSHDTLSAATELMVLSGSIVIYRSKLQTSASEGKLISLPTPLKGGVNEAINIQLSASVTGGVFVSCGGYYSL